MSAFSHRHLTTARNRRCSGVAWLTASTCSAFVLPLAEAQTREARDLEEVIVTAQKREENLQNVPISISVLGGNDLDQSSVEGVTEALRTVPGVATTVHYQGGGTQVSVRGVAANGALFRGASPISYYLDSVPFGLVKSSASPDSNVYDMARIEILRGPQGTLYGANAQNGVVRILTNDANPDEFELKARTGLSSTEKGGMNYRGDMAANVPIIEGKLAARATVGYEDLSGWIDRPNRKDANDAELRNGRLKINGQPTDNLSIHASAWFSRSDYGAPPTSGDGLRNAIATDEGISTNYEVYGLKVGYDFEAFSLSGVTSYLEYENRSNLDLRPLNVPRVLFTGLDAEVFSQEVILNFSQDKSWRWSFGGMYRDAKDRLLQSQTALVARSDFGDDSQSFAVFGELTRILFDGQFELTGGLRYFEDEVASRENVRHTGITTEPLYRAEGNFDKVSPRVVLTWHPAERSTIYASYAEGFRSGANQYANVVRVAPEFPPLEADTLKNYELGAKGSLWDGLITFDTALYYIDWQDVQLTLSVLVGNNFVAAPVNGDSASGMGFEFAMTSEPLTGLQLGVNFGWNDLSSDTDVFSAGAILFRKDDRLNYSPEYTVGASADYEFSLGGNGFTGRFSASANYMSKQEFRNIQGGTSVSYSGEEVLLARTSFSIDSPDHWVTTLFVDNVNNEQGAVLGALFGVADWTSRVRPRTMGVQLEYRF